VSFSGPFWQLREWMGFEGLCLALIEQSERVKGMVAFWQEHVCALLHTLFQHCTPDCIHISEDMAYKEKAMISPAMCREFLMPTWRRWGDQAHAAGVPIYAVDSDGYVGELIPLWIESGFQMNDPQEVAAGNDLPAYRRQFGKRMAYSGGIDKRAMAKGGDFIKAEMRRIDPVIKAGGYVPSCDHAVPPDISWQNMVEVGRRLARATGWLK
jgi:uroporphyrinogen decarboxylase